MHFFHHAVFLELLKGSQLYFSVSPYQAESLSNRSALHTNWIFSTMNHLPILVRARRMLLNLHVFSCLMAEILARCSPAQPTGNSSAVTKALPVQTGTSSKPSANNNRPWSSKLDRILQDYGHLSLSTPSFVEPD